MMKFAPGATIQGRLSGDVVLEAGGYGGHGAFRPGRSGFAGFETSGGDLGWLRLEVFASDWDRMFRYRQFPVAIEAIDWAYNNVPGAPIRAGEGAPTSTPEPGSIALALLAMGASGLLAWRKRWEAMRSEKKG